MDNLKSEKVFVEKGELLGTLYDADAITMKGCKIINQFPAADVAPVRHGRWAHLGGDEWCCTECGYVIFTEGSWEQPDENYCPACGARMDGE